MKILNVAWKEILTTYRDRAALITMLVAPFALTLVMLFAFGNSGTVVLENIPVAIVNQDGGELGQALVDVFESDELADLLEPSLVGTATEAKALVDEDKAAAAVIIPAELTSIITTGGPPATDALATIEVYQNPGRTLSAQIIAGITDQFAGNIVAGYTSGHLLWETLTASGSIPTDELQIQIESLVNASISNTIITVNATEQNISQAQSSSDFNWAQYMGPSMAILFLMFSVARGGRILLVEQDQGTLSRMLASPTRPSHILIGKVLGIVSASILQMLILMVAMRLLMNVSWGPFGPVLAIIVAVSLAATAWGILIGTRARTVAQAGNLGTAISLIFAAASGNFYPRSTLPEFLQKASLISPNAWALDAFESLAQGGGMQDVLIPVIGLLVMTLILGSIAVLSFRRRYASAQA